MKFVTMFYVFLGTYVLFGRAFGWLANDLGWERPKFLLIPTQSCCSGHWV